MKKQDNSKAVAVAPEKSGNRIIVGLLIMTTLLALLVVDQAFAQSAQSARSMGMADSYMLMSSNCEASAANPANLALAGRKNFSLKLASVGGHVANNSFSISDYKKYNGEYLTESDKQDILSKIPTEGLNFDANAGASVLSFSVGYFAVNFDAIGGGRGTLSKDPIELALMGNKVGEVVTADGSGGDSWAAAAVGVSYGRKIMSRGGYDFLGGATFKYLRGLGYFSAEELSAEAVTLETGIDGVGGLTTISATGGSGFAMDLGLAVQGQHAQYGLVVRNAFANINWNKEAEATLYTFELEGMTVENSDDDSLVTSDETTVAIGEYSSRPPLELELGAARNFGKLLVSGSVRQGFVNTAFVSKMPRLAGGVEYPLVKLFDLRGGIAIGGVDDFSLATGIGFNFGPLQIDMAYASSAKLQPWSGNGAKLAISTILEF